MKHGDGDGAQVEAECKDSMSTMRFESTSSSRPGDAFQEVYNYTGETGTYRYMAPEVYRHEPYNAKVRVPFVRRF